MVHEARRIEQDVDLANALGEGVDVGGVADVEPCRLGDAFLAQGGDAAFIDVGGDHGGAFARECDRAGAPDARRRSGDDSALSLQSIRHFSWLLIFLSSFREERSDEANPYFRDRDRMDWLRFARNDGDDLMIIPRDADRAGDVLIARGEFHAGAGGLLADGRAIEFLPRRLVRRIFEAATRP